MDLTRPHDVISESGRQGELKKLDQIIAVRLDVPLVIQLKKEAVKNNCSVSFLVREALHKFLALSSEVK